MKTKKTWIRFIVVAFVVAAISLSITAFATPNLSAAEEEKLSMVKNDYSNIVSDGKVRVLSDDAVYEDAFNTELFSVKSDNYVYLFDEKTLAPKAILLMDESNVSPAKKIGSEEEATVFSKDVIEAVFPDYVISDFDVKLSSYGQEGNEFYSIEFLEKISENLYSGAKISIIVTAEGVLESVVYVEGNSYSAKINEKNTVAKKTIDGQKAIGMAYDAISAKAEGLKRAENHSVRTADNTSTDIIITDSGEIAEKVEIDAYEIFTENRKAHDVTAYQETANDTIVWVIKIENIATNRVWSVGFMVRIDAVTGDVISVYNTR